MPLSAHACTPLAILPKLVLSGVHAHWQFFACSYCKQRPVMQMREHWVLDNYAIKEWCLIGLLSRAWNKPALVRALKDFVIDDMRALERLFLNSLLKEVITEWHSWVFGYPV